MNTNPYIPVKGKNLDAQSRCSHYHSSLDIIAIRMKCCNEYFACIHCHEEIAGHPVIQWQQDELDIQAVLCGVCNFEMTIRQYLESNHHCPNCNAPFNPGCSNHYHFYFDLPEKT